MKKTKKIIGLLILSMMVMILAGFTALADAPGSVRITKVATGESKVKLTWAKAAGAKTYVIYNDQDGELKRVAQVAASKRTYIIRGLKNRQEYTFYITAENEDGESSKSAPVVVTPKVKSPGVVTQARVSANASRKVSIRWNMTKNATGYILYQKTEDGSYEKILQTRKNKVTIKGLTNERAYHFAVRAFRTVKGATSYGPMSADMTGRPSNGGSVVKKIHTYYYKVKVRTATTATGKSGSLRLKPGQTITVTEKGKTRSTAKINGKNYKVSTSALNFDHYSFVTTYKKPYSNAEAEAYVNYKGFSSPTKYLIWINTYCQYLYVFTGSQYNWTVQNRYLCSTGMPGTFQDFKDPTWIRHSETILGVHTVSRKQHTWIFAPDQYAYYATVIRGSGGAIHSWLYYPSTMQKWNAGTLGKPASHGCVRVDIANAKYIYDRIPIGTPCIIY